MAASNKDHGYDFADSNMAHPASSAFAITPDNSNDISTVTRGLYVGVSGDVKVTMHDGETVTFGNLAAGVIHPLRVSRVFATGTTATGILGVY